MSPEIVPKRRKLDRGLRADYVRKDGTTSQHELAIRELLKIDPRMCRNGFTIAVERLWQRIQDEIGYGPEPCPPILFRPDAYMVDEDQQLLHIFEVEDWGPIRHAKRLKMGMFWFHWDCDGRHDWMPKLWLVNRFGMVTTELPMSNLYLEVIDDTVNDERQSVIAQTV